MRHFEPKSNSYEKSIFSLLVFIFAVYSSYCQNHLSIATEKLSFVQIVMDTSVTKNVNALNTNILDSLIIPIRSSDAFSNMFKNPIYINAEQVTIEKIVINAPPDTAKDVAKK